MHHKYLSHVERSTASKLQAEKLAQVRFLRVTAIAAAAAAMFGLAGVCVSAYQSLLMRKALTVSLEQTRMSKEIETCGSLVVKLEGVRDRIRDYNARIQLRGSFRRDDLDSELRRSTRELDEAMKAIRVEVWVARTVFSEEILAAINLVETEGIILTAKAYASQIKDSTQSLLDDLFFDVDTTDDYNRYTRWIIRRPSAVGQIDSSDFDTAVERLVKECRDRFGI